MFPIHSGLVRQVRQDQRKTKMLQTFQNRICLHHLAMVVAAVTRCASETACMCAQSSAKQRSRTGPTTTLLNLNPSPGQSLRNYSVFCRRIFSFFYFIYQPAVVLQILFSTFPPLKAPLLRYINLLFLSNNSTSFCGAVFTVCFVR